MIKSSKKLPKQLYGKKSLTLKHSYDGSFSVFRTAKESHPLITVTASGEYKISLFKLLVILLCIISSAALLAVIVKRLRKYRLRKRQRELWEDSYENYSDDGLPF